ncbi:MAG TPA: hypothetical protein VEA15_06680 [Caulobacteraceae bacterium]|nr:hypothetical protein [Caulobacteraceae bacterium]
MEHLIIEVERDDDGVWRIRFHVEAGPFIGDGSCWGAPESLDEFATALGGHPLRNVATLTFGYGELPNKDVRLQLTIRPIGAVGRLEARVEIADDHDPSCRLTTKLGTTYASLDRFASELRGMVRGNGDQARLVSG